MDDYLREEEEDVKRFCCKPISFAWHDRANKMLSSQTVKGGMDFSLSFHSNGTAVLAMNIAAT